MSETFWFLIGFGSCFFMVVMTWRDIRTDPDPYGRRDRQPGADDE